MRYGLRIGLLTCCTAALIVLTNCAIFLGSAYGCDACLLEDMNSTGKPSPPELTDVSGQKHLAAHESFNGEELWSSSFHEPIQDLVSGYYRNVLDREPDQGGLDFWTSEVERIVSLGIDIREGFQALAEVFFNSNEYLLANKSPTEFVTDLYQTFLNREPDGEGISYWVGQLHAGLATHDMLITEFANSMEFKLRLQNVLGTMSTRPHNNLVNDLYRGFLGRLPDSGGFNWWLKDNPYMNMWDVQCSGETAVRNLMYQIALAFIQSGEYASRHRNNNQYVEDLYNGILKRRPDPVGYIQWVALLDSLAYTREQVLLDFTESDEFRIRVKQEVTAGAEIGQHLLVIVPHPDDEVLGFGGLIHRTVAVGASVDVLIVTNGDANMYACYFWRNGCPMELSSCAGSPCTKEDLEEFGNLRFQESRDALSILGVSSQNVRGLGYPDYGLRDMWSNPDMPHKSNTTRALSLTGKTFTGAHLAEDIAEVIQQHPAATVLTTHRKDLHPDHATLAAIVEDAWRIIASSTSAGRLYEAIIHDGAGKGDLSWPNPLCTWNPTPGEVLENREQRYTPEVLLEPPFGVAAEPLVFCNDESTWRSSSGQTPLLLEAINEFKSQIGLILRAGGSPPAVYEGWVDWSGYFLGFVKKNHLLWQIPLAGAAGSR